jgi:hypothetical protein
MRVTVKTNLNRAVQRSLRALVGMKGRTVEERGEEEKKWKKRNKSELVVAKNVKYPETLTHNLNKHSFTPKPSSMQFQVILASTCVDPRP